MIVIVATHKAIISQKRDIVKEEREISMNNPKFCNSDIRNELKNANVCLWQIAAKIGVAESTFIRWMRFELSDERKQQVRDAIKDVMEEQA